MDAERFLLRAIGELGKKSGSFASPYFLMSLAML
jgi:hypothetical protein